MKEYGTKIMSWGPFAEGRNDFFTNPTLQEIGKEYAGFTGVRCGYTVVPKELTAAR